MHVINGLYLVGVDFDPRCEIKNPKNFPEVNPNEHLAGFKRIQLRRTFSKDSRRSVT